MSSASRASTLIKNVLAMWGGEILAVLVSLLSTPILIRLLKGQDGSNSQYGLWLAIVALTVYFRLLDVWLYQGVIQYFTRYFAVEDRSGYSRVVSTALATLLALFLVGIGIAFGASVFVPSLLGDGVADTQAMVVRLAFVIAALGVLSQGVLDIFAGILIGTESFAIHSGINVAHRFLTALASIAVVALGGGLLGLSIAVSVVALASGLLRLVLARRLVPDLRISLSLVDFETLRELWQYGRWMLVNQSAAQYLVNIDTVIVPVMFGVEAGAVYNLAHGLASSGRLLLSAYGSVFLPPAIAAEARKDIATQRALFLDSCRVGAFLAGFVLLSLVGFGEHFLALWLDDPSFLDGAKHASAAVILSILGIDSILLQGYAGPTQALVALRRVRALATVQSGFAVAGAFFCVVLGQRYGLLAVPWTMVGSALLSRAVLTVMAQRALTVPFGELLRVTVLVPALGLLPMALPILALSDPEVLSGWPGLFAKVTLGLIAALCGGWWFCLKASEKTSVRHWLTERTA